MLAEDANEAYKYFYANAKEYFLLSDIGGFDFNYPIFGGWEKNTASEPRKISALEFVRWDIFSG
jgi:hypothetical protein